MHKKNNSGFSFYVKKCFAVVGVVTMAVTAIPGFYSVARAGGAGAFFGGMMVGHIVGGAIRRDKERTAATTDMAYGNRTATTTYVQQPAPAPQLTTEQRLHQLDKLAAGGYITKEEYKTRRKAILDSL